MINGIVNIYKETGYTSHDVVAKLRGITRQKKIGHTGTLDPLAVGVLPVCMGSGTKLCDMLTDTSKEYLAIMRLGVTTDTQDMSGTIIKENAVLVSQEEVREAIASFVGESMQIPPMYSALKVNGKKLYELAREGKEVERVARPITIDRIDIESMNLPLVTMRVSCSKGTYIRTLCHDIGEKLGCGGTMEHLTRMRVGSFVLQDAVTLGQVEEMIAQGTFEEKVIPVEAMFETLPRVKVVERFDSMLLNGNALYPNMLEWEASSPEEPKIRVCNSQGLFKAIYEYKEADKIYKPVKMFLD